jgi:hypothetical protein
MFVIVDLQSVFNMECVGMFMICVHNRFHMPVSSCLVVIPIKPEMKENTCMADIQFSFLKKLV